jgi:hypothetical protein
MIEELAELLSGSVKCIRAVRERARYVAHPDSPLVKRATAPAEDLGTYGATALIGYEIAAAQIAAAEDHIDAMAHLLTSEKGHVAPLVLARAAIEASARAAYIIDPAVSERDRASEVIAERIHEFEQTCRLIQGHDPSAESAEIQDDLAATRKAIGALRSFAEERGLGVPQRKSFTAAVTRALSASTDDKSMATTAVAAYSALAHASPDMLLTQTVDRSNPEWAPFEVGLGKPNLELFVNSFLAVMLAYSAAVNHQVRAYGWPSDEWAAWLDHVRNTLARYLGDSEDDFRWHIESSEHRWGWDEANTYSVPTPRFIQDMLREQKVMFVEKFGRPPEADDPLFFDPDSDTPRPVWISEESYVSQLLELVGFIGQLTPAREYAIRRCGFVASTHSWRFLPEDKKRDWKASLFEHYADVGEPVPGDFDLIVLPEPDNLE